MRVYFPAWSLVRRELLTTLRGVRAFLLLLLFVSGAVVYAWMRWPESDGTFQYAGYLSRDMMKDFTIALFLACTLFVPAFSAGSIVLERERSTYDFLRMSLIRPSGIVFAKVLNAVGLFFLVLIGLAPAISVSFFLIGVDPVQMGQALAVIVATTLACAAVGVLSSALFNRTLLAMGASYAGVILLMIGPLIFSYFAAAVVYFFINVRSVFGFMDQVAVVLSPIVTIRTVLGSSINGGGMGGMQFALSLCYQAAFALSCLGGACYLVRRPVRPLKVETERPIDDQAALMHRRVSWPFYLIDPLRRKKPIEDGRNAMLVREMRWGMFNRGTTLIRLFYCAFVVYFFAGAVASTDARSLDTMGRWMLVQIAMTIVAAPALTANVFTKEHELRNIDMLRMTLLRPGEIILGKLFALCISVAPLVVAAVFSCLPLILIGSRNWTMLGLGYGTLLVCVLHSISLALAASFVTQRTSVALVLGYVLSLISFVGLWFAAAALGIGEDLASLLSPIGAYIRSSGLGYWASPFSASREAPLGMSVLSYWGLAMMIWLFVSGLMVGGSIAVFKRYRMTDR